MNTQLQRMRDALVAAGFTRQAAEEALQERMGLRDRIVMAVLPALIALRPHAAQVHLLTAALGYADAYLLARIPK